MGLNVEVMACPVPAHPCAAQLASQTEEATMALSTWCAAPTAEGRTDDWVLRIDGVRLQALFDPKSVSLLLRCRYSDVVFQPLLNIQSLSAPALMIVEEAVLRVGGLAGSVEQITGLELVGIKSMISPSSMGITGEFICRSKAVVPQDHEDLPYDPPIVLR